MPSNYWAEFIYDSGTIVLNVGWHAQVQGGFGGVGVEIGFCHWTGLAPLLHLHLQLCPPPIGPPKPTLGMDSPMLETEGQCGAGHRPGPRRVSGCAGSTGGTAGRLRPHHRASGNGGCGVEGAVGMEME